MVAGPNRITRSAYQVAQGLSVVTGETTSLDNTITSEIPVHWISIALRVEKFIVIFQCGNLRAAIAVVNGHDVGYAEYTDGVCAKG